MIQNYADRSDSTDEELRHHGVKGMKWGVIKSKPKLNTSEVRSKYDSTKADYKSAKKAYNKSYNKAYNYSAHHPISQFTNKKKAAESDRRWNDAYDKADSVEKARLDYKQAKAERKQTINKTYRDMQKKASLGEKLTYNNATRKKAAKYVVDNNMTMAEANERAKSDAIRNTGLIVAAYGALAVSALYRNR